MGIEITAPTITRIIMNQLMNVDSPPVGVDSHNIMGAKGVRTIVFHRYKIMAPVGEGIFTEPQEKQAGVHP